MGPPELRRRGCWPILAAALFAGALGLFFPLDLATGALMDRVLSALVATVVGVIGALPFYAVTARFGFPGMRGRIAASFGLPRDLEGASLVMRVDGTSVLKQSFVPGLTEIGLLLVSDQGLVFLGDRGGALALGFSPALFFDKNSLWISLPYARGVRIEDGGRTISFVPFEPRPGAAFERLLARAGA
jgi:hypothetical protein